LRAGRSRPRIDLVLVLSGDDVRALLDLDALVEAVAGAMADLSAGRASVPPRVAATVEDAAGLLAAMPAYLPSAGVLETKLVSLFPGNAGFSLPTHQAVIVCFDPATGRPEALMDATYVTEVRTAAGSALSTRLLAREDAEVLAVLGTGAQARAHARAIPRVRLIREIRVAGRDRDRAEALAREIRSDLGIAAVAAGGDREAVAGADVVCACTHSPEPVVRREWLAPGTHVTSVGYNRDGIEVDLPTVAEATLVVESRAAALAPFPSGLNELRWAVRDGLMTEDGIHAEIGEIVSGARPGRTSPDEITLYRSMGVGAQDAAAAALVLAEARRTAAGVTVEI